MPKNSNASKLGTQAGRLVEALAQLLDVTSPEDARRLRRMMAAGGASLAEHIPTGAVDLMNKGDIIGAALEAAQHAHRRRKKP